MATVAPLRAMPAQAAWHHHHVPGARRRVLAARLLEESWERGWLERPSLDPDMLIAQARHAVGGAALQPGCWRARLDILADDLHRHAALNPLGRVIAHGQIGAALRNRARLEALLARHPEIAELPLAPPVLIVGPMRSGSTRMQRLLACDPRLGFTRFHESWNPLPRWPRALLDDRRVRAWLSLRCAHFFNPDFRHIHPTGTMQPDEEIGLQNVSLFGSAFEAQWHVPGFVAAVEEGPADAAYREFRLLLQVLAWLRPHAQRGRRLILKLPQFAQDLDAVLAAFPGASVIRLHRDPAQVVASSASLVFNQMAVQSDRVDPHRIGREWLRKTRLRERRTDAALAHCDAPRADIGFAEVEADWQGAIARVHAMLGLPLTADVLARMARFEAKQSHRRLARHRYSLAQFGLAEADVRAAGTQDEA